MDYITHACTVQFSLSLPLSTFNSQGSEQNTTQSDIIYVKTASNIFLVLKKFSM